MDVGAIEESGDIPSNMPEETSVKDISGSEPRLNSDLLSNACGSVGPLQCEVLENTTELKVEDIDSKDTDVGISKETVDSVETPIDGKTNDPYFYTKREGDFTSEIYKIEISNFPKYVGITQLKKLLNDKLKVNPHKIKVIGKFPFTNFVFVTFRCEEDREKAILIINDHQFKGQRLSAKKANPSADPLVKKRKEGLSEDFNVKKPRLDNETEDDIAPHVSVAEKVLNAIIPLHKMEYSAQIAQKQKDASKILVKLGRQIESVNKYTKDWLYKQRGQYNFLCCQLLDAIQSPVTEAYRNKCEFNVGLHLETGEKTVGFRISSYKEGSKSVASPEGCINVNEAMLQVAKSFQEYITKSDKDIFNPETHEGYWRQITVRTSLNDDLMVVVVIHPQRLSIDEISLEKSKLKDFFENGEGKVCKVTSLFFQELAKRSNEEAKCQFVYGKEFIIENLLGLKFQISPNAFFQVNTLATELLYEQVAKFAEVNSNTTVLDLCCGTGTIGLTLAKSAKKVIGIELCSSAVLDAITNAKVNGINNIEFVNDKVEASIFRILHAVNKDEDIVAIVDPPRAGIGNKVIKAIRGMEKIKRLVYLSCDPTLAMQNFVDLTRPESNAYFGKYFLPVKAIPVDLFPHTPHCELILLFERT